jgi:hypothetical protein
MTPAAAPLPALVEVAIVPPAPLTVFGPDIVPSDDEHPTKHSAAKVEQPKLAATDRMS